MTEPSLPLALLAIALGLIAGFLAVALRRRPGRRERPLAVRVPPRSWSLPFLFSLLHLTPFDRLSPRARLAVVERLRESDLGPVSMREHGRINLLLGEIALSIGDREEARYRLRSALRWDPRLPIRRTVERLETPSLLAFTSRRAA